MQSTGISGAKIGGAEQGLELALTVSPRTVSTVRRFFEDFVAEAAEGLGADPGLSARVALTVHELLENVALYGEHHHGTLSLSATSVGPRRLTITVTNTTTPQHIERLKQAFREGSDGEIDAMTRYLALMRREVRQDESGLGLARIRAEAEMSLSLSIDRDQVRVSATSEPFGPAVGASPGANQ